MIASIPLESGSTARGGAAPRPCAAAARQSRCRPIRAAAADEHVIEDQPEGVDVGTLIDGCPLACSGAMYSMVPITAPAIGVARQRADSADWTSTACAADSHYPAGRASDPESHDGRFAIAPDHDVRRLKITINDAGLMRRDQAGNDPTSEPQRPGNRQLLVALEVVDRSDRRRTPW